MNRDRRLVSIKDEKEKLIEYSESDARMNEIDALQNIYLEDFTFLSGPPNVTFKINLKSSYETDEGRTSIEIKFICYSNYPESP